MTKPQFSSKALPLSAAFVHAMRSAFGESVEVVAVRENGYEYNNPEEFRAGGGGSQPVDASKVSQVQERLGNGDRIPAIRPARNT